MKALKGLLDTHGPTVPLGQVVVLLRADRLELQSLSMNFWGNFRKTITNQYEGNKKISNEINGLKHLKRFLPGCG